mgnify:CR=1 FL=1
MRKDWLLRTFCFAIQDEIESEAQTGSARKRVLPTVELINAVRNCILDDAGVNDVRGDMIWEHVEAVRKKMK